MTTSKEQTEFFLNYFLRSHSWYKHLPFDERVDFVFFFDYNGAQEVKDKYGDWSFAGGRIRGIDNSLVNIEVANKGGDSEPLNSGLIEKGRIGLNAFIHSSFNQSTNEEYKLKHTNEVARLRSHLLSLLK